MKGFIFLLISLLTKINCIVEIEGRIPYEKIANQLNWEFKSGNYDFINHLFHMRKCPQTKDYFIPNKGKMIQFSDISKKCDNSLNYCCNVPELKPLFNEKIGQESFFIKNLENAVSFFKKLEKYTQDDFKNFVSRHIEGECSHYLYEMEKFVNDIVLFKYNYLKAYSYYLRSFFKKFVGKICDLCDHKFLGNISFDPKINKYKVIVDFEDSATELFKNIGQLKKFDLLINIMRIFNCVSGREDLNVNYYLYNSNFFKKKIFEGNFEKKFSNHDIMHKIGFPGIIYLINFADLERASVDLIEKNVTKNQYEFFEKVYSYKIIKKDMIPFTIENSVLIDSKDGITYRNKEASNIGLESALSDEFEKILSFSWVINPFTMLYILMRFY